MFCLDFTFKKTCLTNTKWGPRSAFIQSVKGIFIWNRKKYLQQAKKTCPTTIAAKCRTCVNGAFSTIWKDSVKNMFFLLHCTELNPGVLCKVFSISVKDKLHSKLVFQFCIIIGKPQLYLYLGNFSNNTLPPDLAIAKLNTCVTLYWFFKANRLERVQI